MLIALYVLAGPVTIGIVVGIWIAIDAWRDVDHTPKPLPRGPHIKASDTKSQA
jgi:hypothetical protein